MPAWQVAVESTLAAAPACEASGQASQGPDRARWHASGQSRVLEAIAQRNVVAVVRKTCGGRCG
jgi:hypothetical protein